MNPAAGAADENDLYLAALKALEYPPDIEAAFHAAGVYYRKVNDALTRYLRGNDKPGRTTRLGTPGKETKSAAWSRAEAEFFASVTTLAAALGVLHPSPTGYDPVEETRRLVADRVGPLCNGWSSTSSAVIDTHHPALDCPVHPRKDSQ